MTRGPIKPAAAIRFDLRGPDHLAQRRISPASSSSRLLRAAALRGHAELLQPLLHAGWASASMAAAWRRSMTAGRRADRGGQRIPRRERRSRARPLRRPSAHRQSRRALVGGDRQHANRLRAHLRQHRPEDLEGRLDLAGAQGGQHRRRALVRNDQRVDAGLRLEQLGGQVLRAADRDRADREAAPAPPSRVRPRRPSERSGEAAATNTPRSKKPRVVIGAKSLTTSNGSFLNSRC
jgi:hypothetical protein